MKQKTRADCILNCITDQPLIRSDFYKLVKSKFPHLPDGSIKVVISNLISSGHIIGMGKGKFQMVRKGCGKTGPKEVFHRSRFQEPEKFVGCSHMAD